MTREGDVVVVVALDRLGRSLSGIIRTIDTSTAVGHMLIGVFGALAQYERTLINERFAAAREAARARGRHVGRPKALTPNQERQIGPCTTPGRVCPRWSPRSVCPGRPCTGC
jgi:DNA invertase Pin-like site-specific DNA recombinase